MHVDFSAAAADFPDPFRLLVKDELASTNDEAGALARAGAPHGLVVLARSQTTGRGRRGARWFSADGDSLTFSVLLRPPEAREFWPRLALAAGVAVARALAGYGLRPGIKWPNDIWLDDKKVAGILVEGGDQFAIVGIGLNVNSRGFPPEVAELATSMALQSSAIFDPAEVLQRVIDEFAEVSTKIGDEFAQTVAEVRQRCVLSGEEVRLVTAGVARCGCVLGVGDAGELVFEGAAGVEKLIQADDIRLVRHGR
ncbi:MAG: biotin--[acetyl-CoA-carboxylase] ligase [Verrucomicrobiota bacterium]